MCIGGVLGVGMRGCSLPKTTFWSCMVTRVVKIWCASLLCTALVALAGCASGEGNSAPSAGPVAQQAAPAVSPQASAVAPHAAPQPTEVAPQDSAATAQQPTLIAPQDSAVAAPQPTEVAAGQRRRCATAYAYCAAGQRRRAAAQRRDAAARCHAGFGGRGHTTGAERRGRKSWRAKTNQPAVGAATAGER